MSAIIENLYLNINRWIKRFRLYQQSLILIEGLCQQGTILIISILTYVFIDYFFFDYKKHSFWILLSLNTISFILTIFSIWSKTKNFRKLAVYIEGQIPFTHNQLVSSLEFCMDYNLYTKTYGYSEDLIHSLLLNTSNVLDKINPAKILDTYLLKKKFYVFTVFLIFFLLWTAFFPDSLANTMINFYEFKSNRYFQDRTMIRIMPQKIQVNKNSSITINIVFYGKIPQEAVIFTGVKPDFLYALEKISVPSFGQTDYTFKNVQMDTYFYVEASQFRSKTGIISITQEPIISDIKKTYYYPSYTGQSPRVVNDNLGDIKALPGTLVKIEANSDKPLKDAKLMFDSGKENILMRIFESTKISGNIKINKPDRYFFSLTTSGGGKNINPAKYNIEIDKDFPPKVDILLPGTNEKISNDMKVNLSISAADDYGVKKLLLKYFTIGRTGEKTVLLAQFNTTKTSIFYDYLWDLNPEKLLPGYMIQYYLEAWDNDTVNGPKQGLSEVHYISFPSLYEIYQEKEQEHDKKINELESIKEESEHLRMRMEEANKNIEQGNKSDWNKDNEINQIKNLHKNSMEKMKSVIQEIEKNTKELEKNLLVKQEMAEKVIEIQKLLNEVMTEEMKNILQKLNESIKKIDIDEKKKDLLDAEFTQDKLIKKLDYTIELLKRTRDQRKLEALSSEAKELEERQRKLTDELEKNSNKDAKDLNKTEMNDILVKQEQIRRETEKLTEDISELAENMKKNNPEISKDLEEISHKLKDSGTISNMKNVENSMDKKKFDNAQEESKKASKNLSEAASQLIKLKNKMRKNTNKELLSMIQSVIYNGLFISHQEEQILLGIQQKANQGKVFTLDEENILDEYAVKEMYLSEGVNNLAQVLIAIAKISPKVKINSGLKLEDISKKMSDLKITIGANDLFKAIPETQEVLTELNIIIAEFLKTSEMMKKEMSKGQASEIMDQLENLTNEQQNLNDLTEMLRKQIEKQGTISSEQMAQLEKMAYEQKKLGEMLDQLINEYNNMSSMMGKLDDVKNLMEEAGEKIKNKDIGVELTKKQNKILSRLLDAQKSLQNKDEYDKNRQAEKAKEYEKTTYPQELPKDLTTIKKKIFDEKPDIQLEYIPVEYREITEKYFKVLSETVW
ncbi:hypothetical protein HY745_10095 [Candidatus Desantisbacteria bacterium]|nr:hypothetical protein [Candidatus Desantisbacteria bacterium]